MLTKIIRSTSISVVPTVIGLFWLSASVLGQTLFATPGYAQQVTSVGDSLIRAGHKPVHMLYIHGIGATGAGDSAQLRKSICQRLDCINPGAPAVSSDRADQGIFAPNAGPPELSYMGTPIWTTNQAWQASAPFVDHYVVEGRAGQKIFVDEINWWPLVFTLKCNAILIGEAQLAGVDTSYIDDCKRVILNPALQNLQAVPSSAVWANRALKISLMDWGFSDALMAVGPMQPIMLEGIRQLVMKSVARSKAEEISGLGGESDYVVVSHSLGSFLMFAALNLDHRPSLSGAAPPVADAEREATFGYVLQHLSQVYFFANQVALLELAELGTGPAASTSSNAQFVHDVKKWSAARASLMHSQSVNHAGLNGPQIVAWSDPNDPLTWHVPNIEGVTVVNRMTKNSFRWLWLVENPIAAHDNYDKNRHVIDSLMKPISSQAR